MSWSVTSIGKVAAVKAALAPQFEASKKNTANIPHESQTVGLVENIVNLQLDFLADIPGAAVKVTANGSVYKSGSPPMSGNSNVSLTVEMLYGLAE